MACFLKIEGGTSQFALEGSSYRVASGPSAGECAQLRHELMFNVVDGVIAITHIHKPHGEDREGTLADHVAYELSSVLGAMFLKLHTRRNRHDGRVTALARDASALVKVAVEKILPLPTFPSLPSSAVGSWIPGAENCRRRGGITGKVIESQMRTWLNYVVVHVSPENGAHSIITQCLRQSRTEGFEPDIDRLPWEARMVYLIGQP